MYPLSYADLNRIRSDPQSSGGNKGLLSKFVAKMYPFQNLKMSRSDPVSVGRRTFASVRSSDYSSYESETSLAVDEKITQMLGFLTNIERNKCMCKDWNTVTTLNRGCETYANEVKSAESVSRFKKASLSAIRKLSRMMHRCRSSIRDIRFDRADDESGEMLELLNELTGEAIHSLQYFYKTINKMSVQNRDQLEPCYCSVMKYLNFVNKMVTDINAILESHKKEASTPNHFSNNFQNLAPNYMPYQYYRMPNQMMQANMQLPSSSSTTPPLSQYEYTPQFQNYSSFYNYPDYNYQASLNYGTQYSQPYFQPYTSAYNRAAIPRPAPSKVAETGRASKKPSKKAKRLLIDAIRKTYDQLVSIRPTRKGSLEKSTGRKRRPHASKSSPKRKTSHVAVKDIKQVKATQEKNYHDSTSLVGNGARSEPQEVRTSASSQGSQMTVLVTWAPASVIKHWQKSKKILRKSS